MITQKNCHNQEYSSISTLSMVNFYTPSLMFFYFSLIWQINGKVWTDWWTYTTSEPAIASCWSLFLAPQLDWCLRPLAHYLAKPIYRKDYRRGERTGRGWGPSNESTGEGYFLPVACGSCSLWSHGCSKSKYSGGCTYWSHPHVSVASNFPCLTLSPCFVRKEHWSWASYIHLR